MERQPKGSKPSGQTDPEFINHRLEWIPTATVAGSTERVEVYYARESGGHELFHPYDNKSVQCNVEGPTVAIHSERVYATYGIFGGRKSVES